MNDFAIFLSLFLYGQVFIIIKECLDNFICGVIVEHDLFQLAGENENSLVHAVQNFSVLAISSVQFCMNIWDVNNDACENCSSDENHYDEKH